MAVGGQRWAVGVPGVQWVVGWWVVVAGGWVTVVTAVMNGDAMMDEVEVEIK